ncbi:MAG TPA: hypothetical protein VM096_04795 [Vicinamibacterales bacterium]|nr:hypothetical protein [Vicinamibacterales bacterium]
MKSYLYYAGMANDRQTEQIGLAIADDDGAFHRVKGDGLIVPIEPGVSWRSVRTCNPTVLRFRGDWWMFYQGVGPESSSGQQLTHVIAAARSTDLVTWTLDARPVLTFDAVRSACPMFEGATGGVIEPSVSEVNGELRMHFVAYRDHYSRGTWLCHARSGDGEHWHVDSRWILSGDQFGHYRLHYPQVSFENHRRGIWFSLIERNTGAAAIVQMTSLGDDPFGDTRQLLPAHGPGLRIEPEEMLALQVRGRRLRGSDRLNRSLAQFASGGRNYLGYSHPHVIDGRIYYHGYHRTQLGQTWMDIGWCEYPVSADPSHTIALSPSSSSASWDAYFVADPFVVTL